MKMRMLKMSNVIAQGLGAIGLSTLAIISSGCQTTPEKWAGPLSGTEVQHLFEGNTVESFNLLTGLTSFTYYHPNGQAMQERLWAKRLGKWSIDEDGRICLQFGKSKLKCRHIVKKGDRYYKIRPDEKGMSETVVRYRYFEVGNALTGS